MLSRAVKRGIASSWQLSSAKYGGRSWPLVAVMLSNLSAVVLFGGGIALVLVAVGESSYAAATPNRYSWIVGGGFQALMAYGFVSFIASIIPMIVTAAINKRYRRRCRTCGH